jgi:3'-phosphoadenosine 5'-phosphosulfate sulfotransferase (PAPS reductase)/FAD synthetase
LNRLQASLYKQYKTIIVPVSGGKDSQVCLSLAVVTFDRKRLRVVHQNTGYDHPLTYKHLAWMSRFYSVTIEHTHSAKYKDIFDFIRKVGYFPNSLARGCTSRLKQEPFRDWLLANPSFLEVDGAHILMGMRRDESRDRGTRYAELDPEDRIYLAEISDAYSQIELRHVTVSLPIVESSASDIFAHLICSGARINPLYPKGHTRVGCYPCLLANNREWVNASRDSVGRKHMQELVQIQAEFKRDKNPRKLVRIHETRDVEKLLREGALALNEEDDKTCGWCSI